ARCLEIIAPRAGFGTCCEFRTSDIPSNDIALFAQTLCSDPESLGMTSGHTTLPPHLAVTEDPPPPTKRPSPVSPEARPGGRTRWRCGITPAGALLMAVVALGWALTSQRPLWHSDLWGHLAYGREIVESGEIPETAPLMPLARGVEFIDSAWLTQVVGYLAIREAGTTAIQLLGGLCVCLTGGVLLAMGWRNTRNLPWTL